MIRLLINYAFLATLLVSQGMAATATYDEIGRLTRLDNTDGSSLVYLYDANGNQTDSIFQPPVDLTVTVDPPGAGTVTGALRLRRDTNASLSATPAGSFLFSGWFESGTLVSSSTTYAFTVTAARNLVAKFAMSVPEIVVEDTSTSPATDFTSGLSVLSFGSVISHSTTSRTINLRNAGTANLTGISSTLEGASAASFSKSSLPSSLAPGASVSLTIQFTPSITGSAEAAIRIASNDSDENPFVLGLSATVQCPTITVTNPSATQFIVGTNISRTFTQAGGIGTVSFALASGTLPSGVTLSSSGVLAGTPSQTGSFSFVVRATDSMGCTGSGASYSMIVSNAGPDGSLDSSFGTDGKVTTNFGGNAMAFGVVLQPDGKAVAAGYAFNNGKNRFAVTRYNVDGSLDTTFNGSGKVITSVSSGEDEAHCLALQRDGKIVVGGFTRPATAEVALVRYNPDGSLDTTFGTGGKVITPVAEGDDDARAITIQPDGKIVIAGYGYRSNGWNDVILLRYNSDGTLDSSFATGGKLMFDIGGAYDQAYGVALQPDGKIVAVGSSYNGSDRWAIVRVTPSGQLDSTFDGDGKVVTSFGSGNDTANSVEIQPDGKIVVGGDVQSIGNGNFGLARYNKDGSLDATFGTGGKLTTDWHGQLDVGKSLSLQQDGKIVLAGFAKNTSGNFDMAIARYAMNGTLDTAFGTGGKALIPIGTDNDRGHALALYPFGPAVVAGYTNDGSSNNFAVVKVNTSVVTPDLDVKEASGTSIAHGATVHLGNTPSSTSISHVFTLKNRGNSALLNLTASIDGPDAQVFAITSSPTTTVAPDSTTTLQVSFSPTQSGARTAMLHINSNDPDESAFEIKLTAVGDVSIAEFNEDLTFDDNQVPSGWTLGYLVGSPGRNASITNGRFDIRQVDTYAYLDKAKTVPVTASGVTVSYTGIVTANHWGQGTQIRLLTTDGEFFASFGKSGYGNVTMTATVGKDPTQPWPFQQTYPLVTGEYRISATFENGRVSYKVRKADSANDLINEVVQIPELQIHHLQNLRMFAFTTTGDPSWIDDVSIRAIPRPPEIVIEQPVGQGIADGGSRDFGLIAPGSNASLTFTIRNTGIADLSGLGITIDGADASQFTVTTSPQSPVAGPAGATAFTIRFSPNSPGSKFAALHLTSNDADESPFDITLSGSGQNASQSWRQLHFNTTENTGDAADEATPMGDGISNLMKFATGLDPTKTGRQPGDATRVADTVIFSYTRSKAAVADGVHFAVEWSDDLSASSWSSLGVTESSTDEGSNERVVATVPAGSAPRKFVRLKVTR